jgi:hypothetical protein
MVEFGSEPYRFPLLLCCPRLLIVDLDKEDDR